MSVHAGLYLEDALCSCGVEQLGKLPDESSVPFVIYFASLGTLPSSRLNVRQALAGTADPSDPSRRHTCYQGKVRHIAGHDGTCADECPPAYGAASDDHRPRAKRRPHSHNDAMGDPVFRSLQFPVNIHRAGIEIVGEHCCRADENLVLKPGGLVDKGVILEFYIVTDDDARANVGSPAHDAPTAQARVLPDLSQMPDRRSRSKRGALIHISRRLYLVCVHQVSNSGTLGNFNLQSC